MRAAQWLLVLLAAIVSLDASAHKDRPIELTESGELLGLPPEYQPARLVIPTSNRENVSLQLGKLSMEFPSCFSELFHRVPRSHLLISSSWYHDLATLPPYIYFQLYEQDSSTFAGGWSFLLDMNTGRRLYSNRFWTEDRRQSVVRGAIDWDGICSAEDQSRLSSR